MNESQLLNMRRKVLGTYMNAEANSINNSHSDILSVRLDERLFDITIHRAIVRAINKLLDDGLPMCGFTVEDVLNKYSMLTTIQNQDEYIEVLSELGATPTQFYNYIDMIIEHKLGA